MLRYITAFAVVIAASQAVTAQNSDQVVGTWKVATRADAAGQVECILDSENVGGLSLRLSGMQRRPMESPGRLSFVVPDTLSSHERATLSGAEVSIDERKSWMVDALWIKNPNGGYVLLNVEPSLDLLLPFLEKGFILNTVIMKKSYSVNLAGSSAAIAVLRKCLRG